MTNYKKNYQKKNCFLEDDFDYCRMCGKMATELHHIQLKSQQGTDDLDNLVAVCHTCHGKQHGIERIIS